MAMRRPVPLRILLAAALLGAGLQGCSEEKPPPPPAPRMARVATVHLTAASLGGQASGVIDSRYNAQLGFLVGGRLVERKVDIGAVVKDGDMLAQLDATDFKNKLAAAQSQLRAAEGEVAQAAPQEERLRTLLKKGYTTQVEYDRAMRNLSTAKARVDEAQANLRLASDQVAYTTLISDMDGAVTAVGADPGQVVNAGQMIVQVSRLDAREGVFSVSEKAISYLKPGMIIRVALQSDPTIAVDGAVREISPNADPVTRTYQLKVALPDAPEAMRLGAVVTGTLDLKGDLVAVIPTGALLQTGEQAAVWVVDTANGTVHRRPVKVLRFDAETVTVGEGLKEGDIIVTAGINSLAEGEKVRLPQEASQ
ncbi:MAG: efflux RND transporter periplasmic adaptor subunit [Dongiaceae bacterium]